MSSPEIVLLDGQHRYFRAAVLKARGYRVFTTEHVVEVCLRWVPGGCAALVIGPQIPLQHIATLCEWIKLNSSDRPIILLSDRRNAKWPVHIDFVIPTQPVQILVEHLQAVLPSTSDRGCRLEAAALRTGGAPGLSPRVRR
ncbi:MAG: hypothetical protein ACM3PW_15690 [Chlamydiota bacterium]